MGIKVTLPDGAIREYNPGATIEQVAESISANLKKRPWPEKSMVSWSICIGRLTRTAELKLLRMAAKRAWRCIVTALPI